MNLFRTQMGEKRQCREETSLRTRNFLRMRHKNSDPPKGTNDL